MTTFQQTITVPPDRRLRLDVALPDTFTPGSQLCLELNPGEAGPKTKESMWDAAEHVRGLYAKEPSVAYLERRHDEDLLEWEYVEHSHAETMREWKDAFPLKPGEQARPLYGLFESDGHEVDRFLEEKRHEQAREDAIDAREAAESEWFSQ
ncbi:MAG: hypothetical protein LBT00_16000 [Spirochaetaceae bacterium]|jgi:hypothetical protein|nr:hypothetical protein [Spirochaetaceae bacterium]